MEYDGNLVMRAWQPANDVIWQSNTAYNYNGYLQVEDYGYLQMYQWSDEKPINWRVPPPPDVGNPAKG